MNRYIVYETIFAILMILPSGGCKALFNNKAKTYNNYHAAMVAQVSKSDDFFNHKFVPYTKTISEEKLEGEDLKEVIDKLNGFIKEYAAITVAIKAIKSEDLEIMDMHQELIKYAEQRLEAMQLLRMEFVTEGTSKGIIEKYASMMRGSNDYLDSFRLKKKVYMAKYDLHETF